MSGPTSRSASAGPTREAPVARRHPLDDLAVAPALDQNARGGRTGLARILDARIDQERQRAVEVGVGEHELRRFSAEFERHRRDMARRRRLHQRPDRDRAGEGKVADAGMGGERRARLLAEARDDVERAGRKTRLPRQVGERERGEAGFLRRLQDAGVAHRQRRADGAPGDLHRIVPRHDMPGDAMRLAQGVDRVAAEIGDGFAHDLVGGAGVKLHVARQRQRVGAALLQGLADVERLDAREFVDPGADKIGELQEQPPALGRGETSPGPMKRALGRLDRRIDIGGLPAGDFADLDPARRIFDRQAFGPIAARPSARR